MMKIEKESNVILECETDFSNEQYNKEELEKLAVQAISKTLNQQSIDDSIEVSLLLTDNQRIAEINNQSRKIDKPTDVLSFPLLDVNPYNLLTGERKLSQYLDECDPETGALLLGDIVISLEKIIEQAKEYDHSFEREFVYMVVHSTLHLLGYDHIEEEHKVQMRQCEKAIMQEIKGE